jgi:hypothetical protein
VIGILAATSIPNVQSNLYADVMFVIGKIELRNPMNQTVELGETTYTTFEELPDQVTQKFYDFNGDGEHDYVEQGRIFSCQDDADPEADKLDVFVSDASGSAGESIDGYTCEDTHTAEKLKDSDKGPWQGIFFDGSQDGAQDFPDLVRLIDREFRDEEIGILKSISEDDLRNTDVLMFRESTGQLILERRGLKPEEAKYRKAVDYNAGENQVAYRIMLRGRNDSTLNVGGGVDRRQSYEDWATEYQLSEPLRTRESDQPRPGEYIKIVAINRATGYTGTARVQLKSAGDPNKSSTTLLDVEVPTITLLPPNLKIWAERDYTVEHGLTKGEDRNYTIGNEGASLTSDTSIRVYTEWLDEEGRPLPDELGENSGKQYGLTGRLAKVVGANQLKGTAIGDDMAEFAIAPGRNTQVLKLKGQTSNTEHFYIHVIGKPKDQECVGGSNCPSFDVDSGQAELAGRPKLLTPFLTPLWDENESWKEYAAYKKTLEELEEALPEGGELADADRPNKPLPSYAWQYRPEYQFSQFDFEVDGIERTTTDDIGDASTTDVYTDAIPSISSDDDLVTVFYSLLASELERLDVLSGGLELVLALGEEESRITVGSDRTIKFENLDSLALLDPEDYLTMRLYTNNDASNILWEWAFYADLEFVDSFDEPIANRHIASNPKPIIHLGAGNDVTALKIGDVNINHETGTATIKLSGKVYCDIADLATDGIANIGSVEISFEQGTFEEYHTSHVFLNDISDIKVKELHPFFDSPNRADELESLTIEGEEHTFIGFFSTTVELELSSGYREIEVRAENVIGNLGTSTVGVNFVVDENTNRYKVANIKNDNRDQLDRGAFSPFWVRVIDDDITPENINDQSVKFMGETHSLVQHDDGQYYADKPFLFVTNLVNPLKLNSPAVLESQKSTKTEQLTESAITTAPKLLNVKNVVSEPEVVAGEYDVDASVLPIKSKLASTYTSAKAIIGDKDWLANIYTYSTNSTVSVFWATSPLEDGWEISLDDTKVFKQVKRGRFGFQNKNREKEENIEVKNILKRESVDGKDIYQIVIDIKKSAKDTPIKHLEIGLTREKKGKTERDTARADFNVAPLKTIILAIDGLGFESAQELLSGAEAANFKRVFAANKTLGYEKPALSALPTITWANWPGVFSGQAPAEHGWLGNSYFPRDFANNSTRFKNPFFHLPIFSSGIEGCSIGVLTNESCTDARQQLGVAAGGLAAVSSAWSMDRRSPESAGSLYDTVADEIGATESNPLVVRSIKAFYERARNTNVRKESSHFSAADPLAHSKEAAAKLDRNAITKASEAWRNVTYKYIPAGDTGNLDIMSIYLPGTDNAGHTFGRADLDHQPVTVNNVERPGIDAVGNSTVEVTSPPDVLREHASTALDNQLGRLVNQIQADGFQNSVLLALTADHGQHVFRSYNDNFALLNNELVPLFEVSRIDGGMGMPYYYRETGLDTTGPDTFDAQIAYNQARVVHSPNGSFGQFYMRAAGGTWQQPPNQAEVRRLAALLYLESTGTKPVQLVCEMGPRKKGDRCDQFESGAPNNTVSIDFPDADSDGVYGKVPAIFVKLSDTVNGNSFGADYEWVKGVVKTSALGQLPEEYDIELGSIADFIAASGKTADKWPALKERINELNHKDLNGSRSGDIITILNGEQGHLTVNHSHEIYAGWHGGPTRSESEVPLLFSLLGNAYTTDGGESELIPKAFSDGYQDGRDASKIKADGYLRNWHLTHVLKKILKQYRGD